MRLTPQRPAPNTAIPIFINDNFKNRTQIIAYLVTYLVFFTTILLVKVAKHLKIICVYLCYLPCICGRSIKDGRQLLVYGLSTNLLKADRAAACSAALIDRPFPSATNSP